MSAVGYYPHRVARGNALAGDGSAPVHASQDHGAWHLTLCGVRLWGPLRLDAPTGITCRRCLRRAER